MLQSLRRRLRLLAPDWIIRRLRPRRRRVLLGLARTYRRVLLTRVTFVGVTGSRGRTTTTDLTAALLSLRHRGTKTIGNYVGPTRVARVVLATRPWDSYCVVEAPAWGKDTISATVDMIRPSLGVFLNVYGDHCSAFRNPQNTLLEKRKLVDSLPDHGVAIINIDDPVVASLRGQIRSRVVTIGTSSDADIWADRISSTWPEHLSFTVHHGREAYPVRTKLNGTHLTGSVLASLAVAQVMSIPLSETTPAVSRFSPVRSRMQEIHRPDGVCFVMDDFKAPVDSIGQVSGFLRQARAVRKIAVVGTLSDYFGYARTHYRRAVDDIGEAADLMLLVHPHASSYLRGYAHCPPNVRAFGTMREAHAFLSPRLEKGDLVLVKASKRHHFERLPLAGAGAVHCWTDACRFLDRHCSECPHLGVAAPVADQSMEQG